MRQGWRWFGPGDPVPEGYRQAGTDIVTALHHKLRDRMEPRRGQDAKPLRGQGWLVGCESIPIPPRSRRGGGSGEGIETWRKLARSGRPVFRWSVTISCRSWTGRARSLNTLCRMEGSRSASTWWIRCYDGNHSAAAPRPYVPDLVRRRRAAMRACRRGSARA